MQKHCSQPFDCADPSRACWCLRVPAWAARANTSHGAVKTLKQLLFELAEEHLAEMEKKGLLPKGK
jgi:hypothetical protein